MRKAPDAAMVIDLNTVLIWGRLNTRRGGSRYLTRNISCTPEPSHLNLVSPYGSLAQMSTSTRFSEPLLSTLRSMGRNQCLMISMRLWILLNQKLLEDKVRSGQSEATARRYSRFHDINWVAVEPTSVPGRDLISQSSFRDRICASPIITISLATLRAAASPKAEQKYLT